MPEIIDTVFAKTSPKRSFSVIEDERFGLVFAKTGSINSGTVLYSTVQPTVAKVHKEKIVYLPDLCIKRNHNACRQGPHKISVDVPSIEYILKFKIYLSLIHFKLKIFELYTKVQAPPPHFHLSIPRNEFRQPVIVLRRETSLLGALKGVGPENLSLPMNLLP